MLGDAGFVDAQFDTFETTIRMGDGDLESCVDYVAAFNGPVAGILRNVGEAETPEIIETCVQQWNPITMENILNWTLHRGSIARDAHDRIADTLLDQPDQSHLQ